MWNKLFKPHPHATNLLIAAAALVLGASISRAVPGAGHWVSLAGIFYLLLTDARRTFVLARRFRTLTPSEKAHVLIALALLALAVRGIFLHAIGYFTVLVLLAVDYLLTNPEPKEEP